jgi:predicted ribosomally synthesized peptide with nif11-like leader
MLPVEGGAMSSQAASDFRALVSESAELQQAARAALAKGGDAALVELGHAHGFDFTVEEGKEALAAGELSEFELEMVAGGVNPVASGPVDQKSGGQTAPTYPPLTRIDPSYKG